MEINIEIAKYDENDVMSPFQKMKFDSIDEAIANVEFLKLGYDFFKNGEILAVRADEYSRIHLIDFDSKVPVNELRKDLEIKYNLKIEQDEQEIEFKIIEKPEKISLNSNFIFPEDNNTKYAKNSMGETMPFKLFRTEDSSVGNNLLRESGDSGENNDFALIERRFTENNSLQFDGTEKIENHNDIAFLFKSLEDEAVEHAFLVYHFEDKSYFLQHISTGNFRSALIDFKQIVGNIIEAKPISVTLIHNHPSGVLQASKADASVIRNLKKALEHTDTEVNAGIIINLRSGKYLLFDEKLWEEEHNRTTPERPIKNIQPYSFSKQVLVENFKPIKLRSEADVAAFITSQKFGISDKTEMLLLNPSLSIIGKFILPPENQENFIVEKIARFGGESCILYGNNITPELVNFYQKRLEYSNVRITDAFLFKSENGKKIWESFSKEGKMKHNNSEDLYFEEKQYSNMEDNLSWGDKLFIPKTKGYKDFVKELQNTPTEHFWADGERILTEKEEKYLALYKYRQEADRKKGEHLNIDKNETAFNIVEYKNDKAKESYSFQNSKEIETFFNDKDIKKNQSFVFVWEDIAINNNAEKEKFLSDLWAKELSQKTELSSGLTNTQIDEKQADYYRKYEAEAKRLGISVSPFITHNKNLHIEIQAEKFAEEIIGKNNLIEATIPFREFYQKLSSEEKKVFVQETQSQLNQLGADEKVNVIEKTIEIPIDDIIYGEYGQDNPNTLEYYQDKYRTNINNQNPNIMENKPFDQLEYLKNQMKYLGFGEDEKLHKDLENGINSPEKEFQIKTSSDKTLPGNKIDFSINFKKSEQGGVFLNSYDANLKKENGEELNQKFYVTKDHSYTAKEAINLLEGRAVKVEFTNPKTDNKETAFNQLNFEEPKNKYGNYDFKSFHQNYGVNTAEIVEKSKLIFDKPEYKDNVIKNLEKGNIVKVKFDYDDNVIEGKAVLSPQDRNLKLYDNDMNRLNTNEPIRGLEADKAQEKSNVREHSNSRGI